MEYRKTVKEGKNILINTGIQQIAILGYEANEKR